MGMMLVPFRQEPQHLGKWTHLGKQTTRAFLWQTRPSSSYFFDELCKSSRATIDGWATSIPVSCASNECNKARQIGVAQVTEGDITWCVGSRRTICNHGDALPMPFQVARVACGKLHCCPSSSTPPQYAMYFTLGYRSSGIDTDCCSTTTKIIVKSIELGATSRLIMTKSVNPVIV